MNTFKKLFGIHSPSSFMRDEIGRNLMRGLTEGLEDEVPDMVRTLEGIAEEISDEDLWDKASGAVNMTAERIYLERSNGDDANVGRGKKDGDEADQNSRDDGPKVVQTSIYLDSRKVAELLTPAISEELAWEGV